MKRSDFILMFSHHEPSILIKEHVLCYTCVGLKGDEILLGNLYNCPPNHICCCNGEPIRRMNSKEIFDNTKHIIIADLNYCHYREHGCNLPCQNCKVTKSIELHKSKL